MFPKNFLFQCLFMCRRFIILSGVVAVVQQIATYVWYLSLPRTKSDTHSWMGFTCYYIYYHSIICSIPANMAIYQVTPAVVFILSVPLLRERVTLLKVLYIREYGSTLYVGMT